MTKDKVTFALWEALESNGFLPYVIRDRFQIIDLVGNLFIEIVVSDGAKEEAVRDLIASTLVSIGPIDASVIVRSLWSIASIGRPLPAYAPDGGLRAAVLVPVRLRAGQTELDVVVSITKLAEMELDRILGRKAPMEEVAEITVRNALRRGGQSYWNPREAPYFEVNASTAPQLSRLLKKSA